MFLLRNLNKYLPIPFFLFISSVKADPVLQTDQTIKNIEIQNQERYRKLEETRRVIRGQKQQPNSIIVNFPPEASCFKINQVDVINREKLPLWLPVKRVTSQAISRCLGINGIRALATTLQNQLIKSGYITTQVAIPNQNLSSGKLTLKIIPGYINQIRLTPDSNSYVSLAAAFPDKKGDLLDLRSLEQALENLQRVPGVDAHFNLLTGDQIGQTDIEITRTKPKYWSIGGWLNDAENRSLGRYQSGIYLTLNNITRLNDMFYASVSREIKPVKNKQSRNGTFFYSLPVGYWNFDFYASQSNILRTIRVADFNYRYRGKNNYLKFQANRVMYRSSLQKATLNLGLQRQMARYYINDTELPVQRKNMVKWELGFSHRLWLRSAVIDSSLAYQRNTSRFGATPLPEVTSGLADSDGRKVVIDVTATLPFQWLKQNMSFSTRYRQQFTPDKLSVLDKFSMGNRYTVRGFDGEMNLMGDKGLIVSNELNWYIPNSRQRLFVGLDYGQVSKNTNGFKNNKLAGSVLGMRGNFSVFGYEAFIGTPIYKPNDFVTDNLTAGFSVNWRF